MIGLMGGGGGDWFAPRVTLGVGAGIGGVFTMLAYTILMIPGQGRQWWNSGVG